MLVILKVKGLEGLNINDMEAGKEVTVTGICESLYFDDEDIKKLEKKAALFDEMIEDDNESEKLKKASLKKDSLSSFLESPDKFKSKYKSIEERFTHSLNSESSP